MLKIILDLERLERLLEYDSDKSKLRPPGPNLLSPSSPKAHSSAAAATAGSRHSLQEAHSAGGSQPGSLGSSLANSRAPSPATGSRTAKGSAGGAGHGGSTGGRRQTPDGDVQAQHVVHNRQLYCAECAGIMEDMCPFTPGAGAGPIASAPSWSQWQQQRQRRANSPLGPAAEGSDTGSQQQAQQQDRQLTPSPFETQQEPGSPSVGCAPRCEVCGKRLRASTTPDRSGLSTPSGTAPLSGAAAQGGASAAPAAAAAPAGADAGDGAVRSSKPGPTSIVGAIAGVLPASIAAALQSVSSGGGGGQQQAPTAADQQQAQQFDAVAAAAADFNAAGSRGGSAQQPAEQWTRWQGVVSAVRGAHGTQQQQPQQQQLQHAGGSSNSLLDASLAEGCSTPGPEVRGTQFAQASFAS